MQRTAIGIMQGRIFPEDLTRLQLFPFSSWQEELFEAEAIGFDFCELLFDKAGLCRELLLDSGAKTVLLESSICVYSVCADYFCSLSLLEETENYFLSLFELFNLIYGSTVEIIVLPFLDQNKITTADQLGEALHLLENWRKEFLQGDERITFAIESLLPAEDILQIMESADFPGIGLCYDLGNARFKGHIPEEEISILGSLIKHLHIKDRKIGGPNVMLGEGDVNFVECFRSLNSINYRGTMVLETPYFNNPVVEAEKNIHFIERVMGEI